MKMETYTIAGSSNTTSKTIHWLDLSDQTKSIVFYASSNLVIVLDFSTQTVICTLKGHTGRVNALVAHKSYINEKERIEIISADDQGSIRIWKCDATSLETWDETHSFNDLNSVMTIDVAALQHSHLISASDINGKCITWIRRIDSTEYIVLDQFEQPKSQLARVLTLIPLQASRSGSFCIAFGGVDTKIYLRLADYDPILQSFSFSSVGSLFGHEDWITCISYVELKDGIIMIISGSQDCKLRVWRVSPISMEANIVEVEIFDDEDCGEEDIPEEHGDTAAHLILEDDKCSDARLQFTTNEMRHFGIYLEAICVGHEDWVTSCEWITGGVDDKFAKTDTSLCFMSTSMDRNIIMWSQDESSGIWLPMTRMGDIGGDLGGCVGGNLLGFVGSCFSPCHRAFLAVGYGGSFHLWAHESFQTEQDNVNILMGTWEPLSFITGHFGSVSDICWNDSGEFLISVSKDQTCRLFAPITSKKTWHEISRPQIHGFDLNCVAMSPTCHPGLLYLAGDEKVIRVLDCPNGVMNGVKRLCGINLLGSSVTSARAGRVDRAYIPELGLSNKASDLMSMQEQAEKSARNVASLAWTSPPLEGQLADHTLWPEVDKLFGHTNDVVCLALSLDGKYLATACKARNAATAAIYVWDTCRNSCLAILTCHESTVVCIRFSNDTKLLASAGKDRSLCIHELITNDCSNITYETVLIIKGAHKRIVWDCSWTSCGDYLMTGSRDGMCKLWQISKLNSVEGNQRMNLLCILAFLPFAGAAVTSLDIFHGSVVNMKMSEGNVSSYLCAIGSESGDISAYKLNLKSSSRNLSELGQDTKESVSASHDSIVYESQYAAFVELYRVKKNQCHGSSVQRLRWNPLKSNGQGGDVYCFATCGDDFSIRVHSLLISS